jgi:hypothetical protein
VYGRSRILKDTEIDLSNCLEACGKGEVVSVPSIDDLEVGEVHYFREELNSRWSKDFQWLPCEVRFDAYSEGHVKYVSSPPQFKTKKS